MTRSDYCQWRTRVRQCVSMSTLRSAVEEFRGTDVASLGEAALRTDVSEITRCMGALQAERAVRRDPANLPSGEGEGLAGRADGDRALAHSGQGREIMELFTKLNDAGTTIIQVTHSEENAKFGKRIIELRDGWIAGAEG